MNEIEKLQKKIENKYSELEKCGDNQIKKWNILSEIESLTVQLFDLKDVQK